MEVMSAAPCVKKVTTLPFDAGFGNVNEPVKAA
jgi:hypothetical protein